MTYEEIKALAKQHFNLVEAEAETSEVVEENFASATLEDGTKVTNDKDSAFAVGDKVFVEVDGEKKPAPEGDHITESGMTITLDADSIITGMKRPDEAGEGSEGLAEDEEEMTSVTEEMSADEVESNSKETTDEAFEEEAKEEKMELEDVIKVIAEVVDEKMMEIKEKMKEMEDKMKSMDDKMSAFASEPAEESVVSSNFSKAKEVPALNEKRYFAMLEKLQTLTK